MTPLEIRKAFGGRLVGTKRLKEEVCIVTSRLPDEMQKYITKYVWFVGSMEDAWGFVFTGNDLLDQHLIFLSDDLLNQDEEQIHWSIAHEIGHVILKHKNNIFVKQTKQAIQRQENEADQFAAQFS
ncbi:MAG TPA: ImmA/IrrE family metallo-endopeptidase [Patescibacteria group bacterium]|nr:ImmA/IrrE family metallo-endopeptidase [Patescibacteria group bacterium]